MGMEGRNYQDAIKVGEDGDQYIDQEVVTALQQQEAAMEKFLLTAEQITAIEDELAKPDLPEPLRKVFLHLLDIKGVERVTMH